MTTNERPDQPTRQQAQDALQGAERAEDVVRHPPLPVWFFPIMTLLMVAFILAQLLDEPRRVSAIVCFAMVGLNAWTYRRAGISGPAYRFGDMVPMLAALLVTISGAAILNATTELSWIWVVAAVIAGVIVAVHGWMYQRSAEQES